MDKKKDNKDKRNESITADYRKYRSTKEHGVAKYTHAWICATLSLKYFLAEETIEKIVARGSNTNV